MPEPKLNTQLLTMPPATSYNTLSMGNRPLLAVAMLLATTAVAQTAPGRTPAKPRANYIGIPAIDSLLDKQISGRPSAPSTRSAAEVRQAQIRSRMLHLLGPLPARTPLNPVILGQTSLPGMRIQKVLFDSQPGFHVTALLYLPDATLVSGALPAIVMAPGHYPEGKAADFDLASAFARNGFAVLSYDPLGQGERLQYPDPKNPEHSLAKGPTGEHGEASLQPMLLGESVAKYFLWDGMRAIDYLETRGEIDPTRIGAFGCSGGGADTALLGALDPRVAAIGTACYLTSWSALLDTLGPQDGEQSTPGWIAAGLGFPDYVEAAAPRPYAIIATEADMFPFAGTVETEHESRQFYKAFAADKQLAFITGPGGHGNLKPILPRILRFFIDALHPALNAPIYDDQSPAVQPPPGALLVTPTGQVSTFDVNAETVFTLNLKHAASVPQPHPGKFADLQAAVNQVTGLDWHLSPRRPGRPATGAPDPDQPWASVGFKVDGPATPYHPASPTPVDMPISIHRIDQSTLSAVLTLPSQPIGPPALALLLVPPGQGAAVRARVVQLALSGHIVLTLTPEPASPGNGGTKASVLGPWYLPSLSAELAGKTILGLRLADTLAAIDYLTRLRLPHQPGILAEASGHFALVLLHAAIFDTDPATLAPARLKQIRLHALPPTYAELLTTPAPPRRC